MDPRNAYNALPTSSRIPLERRGRRSLHLFPSHLSPPASHLCIYCPQHFLYFFPLPQGQGSFLPILLSFTSGVLLAPSSLLVTILSISTCCFGFGALFISTWNRYFRVSSCILWVISSNILKPSF